MCELPLLAVSRQLLIAADKKRPAEAGFFSQPLGEPVAAVGRSYCFDGSNPRSFFIASMLGARPRPAAYILGRSSVLPRDSAIWRKRSPLARVRPPCSSNQP